MMALANETEIFLNDAYQKKISAERIVADIDRFISSTEPQSILSKQLKFLKRCVMQVDLYLPCVDCEYETDRLLTPHRHIDHLRKWFFDIAKVVGQADECQAIFLYLDKVKDNPVAYSMLLTIAPIINYNVYVQTHPESQRGMSIKKAARHFRYRCEQQWLAKLRKLVQPSKRYYIRACGDYSNIGPLYGLLPGAIMHSFYGADCRGINMQNSHLFVERGRRVGTYHESESAATMGSVYYTNLQEADLRYANLAGLQLPVSSENILYGATLAHANIYNISCEAGLQLCSISGLEKVIRRCSSSCTLL